MSKRFRESEFVDFNTGTVKLAPLQLQFRMTLAGSSHLADLLRLFECRMEVWHLGVAVQILHDIEFGHPPSIWSHAAYALVAMLLTYFETIGRIINTDSSVPNTTAMDFECGFRDVYPIVTTSTGNGYDPQEFYQRARNGLYALGSTKRGLWVHNEQSISPQDFDIIQKNPADPASEKYLINPHAAVRTMVDHFPTLIQRLHDPATQYDAMRAQFKAHFSDMREG